MLYKSHANNVDGKSSITVPSLINKMYKEIFVKKNYN